MPNQCSHISCTSNAEPGKDICYKHKLQGIGFTYKGGARTGRSAWNVSKKEHMQEHLGTTDDRELGRRGIELDKHITTPRYK